MRRPEDFEFNIGFDEDEEEYYVVFAPLDEEDSEVWLELKVIVPPGFWCVDGGSTYEFMKRPHDAIEVLKRHGFKHNLDLV